MDAEDTLFKCIQTLSDDAEAIGLTKVALVLEFAMDVYLHERAAQDAALKAGPNLTLLGDDDAASPDPSEPCDAFTPQFFLAQVYRHAS